MRSILAVLLLLMVASCATTQRNRLLYYKVKVKSGESVAEIALKFDTTWQRILRDNGLKTPQQVKPGMVLKVKPGPGGYLVGTDKMKRSVTRRSSSNKKGFWSRLFGDDESSSSRRSGGLFYGGSQTENDAAYVWPLKGPITSRYGSRWYSKHKGIDIDGRTGDRVIASAGGTVSYAGWMKGYGRLVIIDHGRSQTRYAHLHRVGVSKSQRVNQGQYIGQVGATGNATGSHLHFEIRNSKLQPVNPLEYLSSDELLSAR